MFKQYKKWKPSAKLRPLFEAAVEITTAYLERLLTLSLRQLFYRMVATNLTVNNHNAYKQLQRIVKNARNAGLLDWDAIEDRTRDLVQYPAWDNPADALASITSQYANDLWASQPKRVEVWIEKDALVGVIEAACREWQVPMFSCHGDISVTELRKAGVRIAGYAASGQEPVVLYLGDHDPSGMRMRDTVENGIRLYSEMPFNVQRIALNLDQIKALNLPPNKIKEADTSKAKYQAEFGDESWELDALDPDLLDRVVRDAIADNLDADAWDEAVKVQEAGRQQLEDFVEQLGGSDSE